MAGNSDSYHEPYEILSGETKDMHRAIVTVMEELEAIDWYQQRAEACGDEELKRILLHNKEEEVEHAMMTIEWIRRRYPTFDEQARTYLFSEGAITEVEERAMSGAGEKGGEHTSSPGESLGIGSLKSA